VTLDESHNQDDVLMEAAGIPLVFTRDLEQYLQEGTLDYNFPLKFFMSIPDPPASE